MTLHFMVDSEEYDLAEVECAHCSKPEIRANTDDCLECEAMNNACHACLEIHRHQVHGAWQEYGRRKRAIENTGLTPDEYDRAVRMIAEELGI